MGLINIALVVMCSWVLRATYLFASSPLHENNVTVSNRLYHLINLETELSGS